MGKFPANLDIFWVIEMINTGYCFIGRYGQTANLDIFWLQMYQFSFQSGVGMSSERIVCTLIPKDTFKF